MPESAICPSSEFFIAGEFCFGGACYSSDPLFGLVCQYLDLLIH